MKSNHICLDFNESYFTFLSPLNETWRHHRLAQFGVKLCQNTRLRRWWHHFLECQGSVIAWWYIQHHHRSSLGDVMCSFPSVLCWNSLIKDCLDLLISCQQIEHPIKPSSFLLISCKHFHHLYSSVSHCFTLLTPPILSPIDGSINSRCFSSIVYTSKKVVNIL